MPSCQFLIQTSPYVLVTVDLEEGPRMNARVAMDKTLRSALSLSVDLRCMTRTGRFRFSFWLSVNAGCRYNVHLGIPAILFRMGSKT